MLQAMVSPEIPAPTMAILFIGLLIILFQTLEKQTDLDNKIGLDVQLMQIQCQCVINEWKQQNFIFIQGTISLIFRMNRIYDRTHNSMGVPLTPNLEQYKLHSRNKTKKKNACPIIQPTLQPIHLNPLIEKTPTTPTGNINNLINANSNKAAYVSCQYHPDKRAIYTIKENSKRMFCGICAVTDGGGDSKFLDQESKSRFYQEFEKTQSIQSFKRRVNNLQESISIRQTQIYSLITNQEQQYGQYFAYLNSSFKDILENIQQKHRQLNNSLIECIKKRKKAMSQTFQLMETIKKSIERYIYDINKNYEDILAQLSIQNFRDIMRQYNAKVQYYADTLHNKQWSEEKTDGRQRYAQGNSKNKNENFINGDAGFNGINVYLPLQEIRRIIEKANVQYLGLEGQKMGSTRSLQKVMSSSNINPNPTQSNINLRQARNEKQRQAQERNERNLRERIDRKSQSKIQQGRKRNNTQGFANHNGIVHQIRGANKQNMMDPYYSNGNSHNYNNMGNYEPNNAHNFNLNSYEHDNLYNDNCN